MSVIDAALDRVRLAEAIQRLQLTIHPLALLERDAEPRGRYVPIADAIRTGVARVTEISDDGAVPQLAVRNHGGTPLFILDGEQLVGAKQNRVVNLSMLVPHTSLMPIPVSCVERGRWSYRTREAAPSPFPFFGAGRAMNAQAVTHAMKERGSRAADQDRVWRSVDHYADALNVASDTDSLHDVYEQRRASLDEYLAGLAAEPGQVGAVFAIGRRLCGVELFESEHLWDRYYTQVVAGYALDALVDRRPPRQRPESPEALLDEARTARMTIFPAVGLGEDLRIESERLVGGALLLDGQVVHLAAFRRACAAA